MNDLLKIKIMNELRKSSVSFNKQLDLVDVAKIKSIIKSVIGSYMMNFYHYKHIQFNIDIELDGVLIVTCNNLYTFMLMQGIEEPGAIGKNKFVLNDDTTYEYDEETGKCLMYKPQKNDFISIDLSVLKEECLNSHDIKRFRRRCCLQAGDIKFK